MMWANIWSITAKYYKSKNHTLYKNANTNAEVFQVLYKKNLSFFSFKLCEINSPLSHRSLETYNHCSVCQKQHLLSDGLIPSLALFLKQNLIRITIKPVTVFTLFPLFAFVFPLHFITKRFQLRSCYQNTSLKRNLHLKSIMRFSF